MINNRISTFELALRSTSVSEGSGNVFQDLEQGLQRVLEMLELVRSSNGRVILIGNGGSSAVASHAVVDFLNVGKISSTTIHDPALLTCMSNDYGYENSYSRVIETIVRPNDLLVAISSSGNSLNIVNSVQVVKKLGGRTLTLSGFSDQNLLRKSGDLNIWINSSDYGCVEIGHLFILHNLSERLRVS